MGGAPGEAETVIAIRIKRYIYVRVRHLDYAYQWAGDGTSGFLF